MYIKMLTLLNVSTKYDNFAFYYIYYEIQMLLILILRGIRHKTNNIVMRWYNAKYTILIITIKSCFVVCSADKDEVLNVTLIHVVLTILSLVVFYDEREREREEMNKILVNMGLILR